MNGKRREFYIYQEFIHKLVVRPAVLVYEGRKRPQVIAST